VASRFEEVKTELGYIVDKEGTLVGTWLWKEGNMTVSTKNKALQEVLSRGVQLVERVFDRGEIQLSYSPPTVRVVKFTPVELSSILAPDFYCITAEERKKGVSLPANTGRHSRTFKQVHRGYVLERLKGRDITIGIWFYSPGGIVCQTNSRTFDREFHEVKKKLTRTVFTRDGVREVPLPFNEATYFDVNLKLPSRYFLVPSWGIETSEKEKFEDVKET